MEPLAAPDGPDPLQDAEQIAAAIGEEPPAPLDEKAVAAVEADGAVTAAPPELEKTVAKYKQKLPPKVNAVAAKRYEVFNRNRTPELFMHFFGLVGGMDFADAKYSTAFTGEVPFPGKKCERPIEGMAYKGLSHGLIRYVYHSNLIEETRFEGKEHGLRVVCTEMGDIWVRFHNTGVRLAQVVLNADYTENKTMAKDDGGLKLLRQHLHLVQDCFEMKAKK